MRWLPAGSILWLLANEMRLSYRGSFRTNRLGMAITIVLITVLTVFAGLPLAVALQGRVVPLRPAIVISIDLAVVVLFTLLLSQTLSSATLSFFERGDLDLLLSSPIPPRRVLTVRALAIAMQPLTIFLSLLGPLVGPLALFGHAPWLASIGVLVSLSLLATAIGLMIAMGLFALIGPRRTRTVGQLLAAFIGAGLFLVGQSRYFFPKSGQVLFQYFRNLTGSGLFTAHSILGWPAKAVNGEPVPFAILCGACVFMFAASTTILGSRFSRDASVAAGVGAGGGVRRSSALLRRFRAGTFAGMVRKELLLLARDPALLSQVILRVLYLLPLLFLLVRNTRTGEGALIANGTAGLVFIASQIAASLAWITISAEDAPDLLLSAPVSGAFVRRAKTAAALLPIAVLLVLPILYLGTLSPAVAALSTAGIAAASLSAALINLWYEAPGQRRQFRRRGSGNLVSNIAVLVLGMAWSATCFAAALGTTWAVAGAAATLALLYAFYRGRTYGRT